LNPNYQFPGGTETNNPYGGDGASSMDSKYMKIKKQIEMKKE